MAINNHVVNTNGRGSNAYSDTFHGLRRTVDGKLYYTLRDKNVGTFSNDGASEWLHPLRSGRNRPSGLR